jgi:hypothetical protein
LLRLGLTELIKHRLVKLPGITTLRLKAKTLPVVAEWGGDRVSVFCAQLIQ